MYVFRGCFHTPQKIPPQASFDTRLTAGLDARAAAIVMRAVRNIVDTGRTIVCTIHQPSIQIFEVHLLVLNLPPTPYISQLGLVIGKGGGDWVRTHVYSLQAQILMTPSLVKLWTTTLRAVGLVDFFNIGAFAAAEALRLKLSRVKCAPSGMN